MIKILYLIPNLDCDGAGKQLTLLATHLPNDEFDPTVAVLTHSRPYEEDLRQHNIRTIHLQKRWKFDPVAFGRLRSLIKKEKPHILHTWMFSANTYSRMAVGSRQRPKVIISEQYADDQNSRCQQKINQRLLRKTDRIICHTQRVADSCRNQKISEELLRVIPNAVESAAKKDRRFREKLLAEFNFPSDAILVGFVGRLESYNRVHDLLWGFQVLRQLVDSVFFLVVGDGPERHRLEKLPSNFDCDRLVRFLGHRKDTRQLVSQLDIFWHGGDADEMSCGTMEAMVAGVPVVASDTPSNRELIDDGETGILAAVGEGNQFAQITARLLENKPIQKKLSEAAQKRMQTEYSIESMVRSHLKLYREVIEG